MQINLIQAIRLLGISDSECITFATKHGDLFAPFFSVSEIRKLFDMRAAHVTRIYTHRHIECYDIEWEFIVDQKTYERAVLLKRRKLERAARRIFRYVK